MRPFRPLFENGGHDFFEASLQVRFVGQGPHYSNLTSTARRDSLGHQASSIYEQPGTRSFLQSVLLQVSDLFTKFGERFRLFRRAPTFALNDLCLNISGAGNRTRWI